MTDHGETERVVDAFGRRVSLTARGSEASAHHPLVNPPAEKLRIYASDGKKEIYTGVDVDNAVDSDQYFEQAKERVTQEDFFDSMVSSRSGVRCSGGSHHGRYLYSREWPNERRVQHRQKPDETELYLLAQNSREGPLYIFEPDGR